MRSEASGEQGEVFPLNYYDTLFNQLFRSWEGTVVFEEYMELFNDVIWCNIWRLIDKSSLDSRQVNELKLENRWSNHCYNVDEAGQIVLKMKEHLQTGGDLHVNLPVTMRVWLHPRYSRNFLNNTLKFLFYYLTS